MAGSSQKSFRVFEVDALKCEHCGGKMKILAAITQPAAIAGILKALSLPTEAPSFHPARAPPQTEFDFDDAPADDQAVVWN